MIHHGCHFPNLPLGTAAGEDATQRPHAYRSPRCAVVQAEPVRTRRMLWQRYHRTTRTVALGARKNCLAFATLCRAKTPGLGMPTPADVKLKRTSTAIRSHLCIHLNYYYGIWYGAHAMALHAPCRLSSSISVTCGMVVDDIIQPVVFLLAC